MSNFKNSELEKQLANLQIKTKRTPPAVPPKKKAQPQVPQTITLPEKKIDDTLNFDRNQPASSVSHGSKDLFSQPSKSYNSDTQNDITQFSYDKVYPFSTANYGFTPSKPLGNNYNHEEFLPPSSPVSSNYSELARATENLNINQEKLNPRSIYQNLPYGNSQTSTYVSPFEPINSQLPNYMLAQSKNKVIAYENNYQNSATQISKEKEVDELTDLLVRSITDSQDLDFFGICMKCNEKVIGARSGCTAMGNIYHINCFCCYQCNTNLHGKRLYAVDGEPYCESDYYETLEKCSVCNKPILDRILRATGNPYHHTCFTCVECGKNLDGIPFTVDALNHIHCIEDFHKKFAPRCCVCELPILPEEGEEETVRVVALDRSFHVNCYRCEDCGLVLSSEADGRGCYPLDGHILCKHCNAHRIRLLTSVMTTDL